MVKEKKKEPKVEVVNVKKLYINISNPFKSKSKSKSETKTSNNSFKSSTSSSTSNGTQKTVVTKTKVKTIHPDGKVTTEVTTKKEIVSGTSPNNTYSSPSTTYKSNNSPSTTYKSNNSSSTSYKPNNSPSSYNKPTSYSSKTNSQSTFNNKQNQSSPEVVKCGLPTTTYLEQPSWAYNERHKNREGQYRDGMFRKI